MVINFHLFISDYYFVADRRRKSLFPINLSKKTEAKLIENPTAVDIRKIMVPARRQASIQSY